MPRPDVSHERIPQILDAALDLFGRKGIDGSGMNELSRVTGLSKAAIYHYFLSKDAIILALVERFFGEDQSYIGDLAMGSGSAREKIMSYVDHLGRFLDDNRALLPVSFEIYSRADRQPEIRAQVVKNYRRYRRIFETLIREGLEAGEFSDGTDAAGLASALVSLIEGSVLVAGVSGRKTRTVLKRDVGSVLQAAYR